jgi:hypothetical protein
VREAHTHACMHWPMGGCEVGSVWGGCGHYLYTLRWSERDTRVHACGGCVIERVLCDHDVHGVRATPGAVCCCVRGSGTCIGLLPAWHRLPVRLRDVWTMWLPVLCLHEVHSLALLVLAHRGWCSADVEGWHPHTGSGFIAGVRVSCWGESPLECVLECGTPIGSRLCVWAHRGLWVSPHSSPAFH